MLIGDAPELRRRLRDAAEAEERESYEHRMSPEWLAALEPLGTDWRKPHLTDAPWLIVVLEHAYGMQREAHGRQRKVKHYYVRESVGIAVGILLASLTHAGLATLTHTPSPMGFLAAMLGRPDNERPYVVIPVGYPAPEATMPRIRRKRLSQVLIEIEESAESPGVGLGHRGEDALTLRRAATRPGTSSDALGSRRKAGLLS